MEKINYEEAYQDLKRYCESMIERLEGLKKAPNIDIKESLNTYNFLLNKMLEFEYSKSEHWLIRKIKNVQYKYIHQKRTGHLVNITREEGCIRDAIIRIANMYHFGVNCKIEEWSDDTYGMLTKYIIEIEAEYNVLMKITGGINDNF